MLNVVEQVRYEYELLRPMLDERAIRLWAAAKAMSLGTGGGTIVTRATGIRNKRIWQGKLELTGKSPGVDKANPREKTRIRRSGAGRKSLEEKDPKLVEDLEKLVAPATRGDPMSPLRWTCKSVRKLAEELGKMGHKIGRQKVSELLAALGYTLQAPSKTKEGGNHPDRNAQFEYINSTALAFQKAGQPVVSVDTKKKELLGEYRNAGQEWQPKGQPEQVNVYDFIGPGGKVSPYGVYDVFRNEGWVNVGVTHDTAEFAVESIRRWWHRMGKLQYPAASELMITADGGGSNGYRVRLWKVELQKLADETGLHIHVCHYPPGTSKWNKIEHRMFCHISENWRGRPLSTLETVVNLIANTSTQTGLRIEASADENCYEPGKKVSDESLCSIRIDKSTFHGEWNYTSHPKG